MKKATIALILVSLFLFPFTTQASEGIPLQKDVILGAPITGPQDLPEEITFTLYDVQNGLNPLGSQTFARGQYTVDFEFSQSNGVTGGNVARVKGDFTNILNLKDASGQTLKPKEIWAALEVGGTEVGARTKVPDETLVRLLLNSDASLATYLTLAYEGDSNPITTIYKDLPISLTAADGSKKTLSDYFSGVVAGTVGVTPGEGSTISPYWERVGGYLYYNDGNVGIGTTGPIYKFQISGGKAYFAGTGPTTGWTFGNCYAYEAAGTNAMTFTTNNKHVIFSTGTGKVGIGTVSPDDALQVTGSVASSHFVGLGVKNSTAYLAGSPATARINFERAGTTSRVMSYIEGGNTTITSDGNGFLALGTKQSGVMSERLRITNTGNVGIGTIDPGTYKLAVAGTVRCTELTVDSGWADFVFEENYRLPSLDDVERFISENKHLPGIPPQTEVKREGVSVGNISSRLLQKIEELTLYVIDIKKQNDVLKARLGKLEGQLKEIQN